MTKAWQISSGEKVHSDFPPMRKFKILVNNALIYAAPFKAKTAVLNEDLLPIIEQNNFTNKYLQVFGEHLSVKIPPSTSSISLLVVASSSKQPSGYKSALDTLIFKPYEISNQLRTEISSPKIDSELQSRIDKIEQAIKLAYVSDSPSPKTKDDKQKAFILSLIGLNQLLILSQSLKLLSLSPMTSLSLEFNLLLVLGRSPISSTILGLPILIFF
ncbi:hypothetical protein ACH5RR_011991 [Cinchona calisaya]|uniref:Uncharacterized protein n=1 Tax=Cinchona calisaya TaxID=153742 RepID=A0ABD3A9W6_9GENT